MGEDLDEGELELRSGFLLFFQQCKALLKKNALLAWRSRLSTFLQLMAPLFFIFLVFVGSESISTRDRLITTYTNLADPQPTPVTAIPSCEDGYLIKTDGPGCWDFIYSPNNSTSINSIVHQIRSNNPGRPIPARKTLGFATLEDAENYLIDYSMRVPAAVHFQEREDGVIAYGIQTNSTPKIVRGMYENPNFKFQIPLQAAVEREIVRLLVGDPSISWNVNFTEFAHPSIENFSAVDTVGPTLLLAAFMFGFVIQMGNLVREKELKLRQTMNTMGLMDSAYWITWLLWELSLGMIGSVNIVLFGMIFQFDFFLHNNFFVLFFLFFLFSMNMTSFAFMLSVFVDKASSATTVGFLFFIIACMTQIVTLYNFPYDESYAKEIQYVWSSFPPNLLTIGLSYLGDATSTTQDKGIKWSNRNKCSFADTNCQITIESIYRWLAVEFFVWLALAVYFDNVLPDANGVRKPWTYFLRRSYWTGKGAKTYEGSGCCTCTQIAIPTPKLDEKEDEDVFVEENLVKEQKANNVRDPLVSVAVQGLRKAFPGRTAVDSRCYPKCTKPYDAVKGLWFNVEKAKIFCLLGPNGAGKTTTINCLTGIIPTTNGDGNVKFTTVFDVYTWVVHGSKFRAASSSLICGDSIRTPSGIRNIRSRMGVCPQFDVLWGPLTGREHLELFGSIKGLKPKDVNTGTEKLLSQVKLLEAAKVRSASYSGGMKRRLSVAIALIGNPKILFLDEPTTGMDPVTRRYVWDIIETLKKTRAIVLTTHSMEEADILGDRIAIMVRGRFRCIGTSIHLKNRFGVGYVVNVSVSNKERRNHPEVQLEEVRRRVKVKEFFKEQLDVELKSESRAYMTFIIPRSKENELGGFFGTLSEHKHKLGISDIQISLTTLEEVFLKVSKEAELKSATAEGRFDILTLTSGPSAGKTIKIPTGAPFALVPGTESNEAPNGMMVEVSWHQDDNGSLCIAQHSELKPVPATKAMDHAEVFFGVKS